MTVKLWCDDYENDDANACFGSKMSFLQENRILGRKWLRIFQKRGINGTAWAVNASHSVVLGLVNQRGKYFYGIFSPFDGWLTFDGLRFSSFCDFERVEALSFETLDVFWRLQRSDSSEYSDAPQWSNLFLF